jgi:hypothetical protein
VVGARKTKERSRKSAVMLPRRREDIRHSFPGGPGLGASMAAILAAVLRESLAETR